MLHQDGTYHWVLARGIAVWDAEGNALRIAGSLTDISSRKEIEEQLRHDALHDSLTGLGNRILLIEHLRCVNERKKRIPDLIFALFFIDFDRFKQVNDTLGHSAGDQLLVEASRRLESSLRGSDIIARFSGDQTVVRIAGDEFVILLEDFRSAQEISRVADRLLRALRQPYDIGGRKVTVSASIGLAVP
jgi:diguanylate cyclase (GGDEF)-like protein